MKLNLFFFKKESISGTFLDLVLLDVLNKYRIIYIIVNALISLCKFYIEYIKKEAKVLCRHRHQVTILTAHMKISHWLCISRVGRM